MLSSEIKFFIDMLSKDKAANRGKKQTAESALETRRAIDQNIGGHTDPQIEIEMINNEMSSGEFYTNQKVEQSEKIILFIHGGGFSIGSVESRRKMFMEILKESGLNGYSVDYGQWPEAKHPQGLLDSVNAYKYLLDRGYKTENIYMFGESAGAMLVLTSNLYLKDKGFELPAKTCVFSPVAGQNIDLPSHSERDARDPMITIEHVVPYYEGSDFNSPYVSPAYGDFTGFPKLYIHVGTEEVLYDDAALIYEKCKEAKVDVKFKAWEGLFHVFPLFPSPETDIAIKDIADYFKN